MQSRRRQAKSSADTESNSVPMLSNHCINLPTPGRRNHMICKPAEYYLECMHIFQADKERLSDQLKEIFQHGEKGDDLINSIKTELSDRLLVSAEVLSNPKVYSFLREALENCGITVPATVQDTIEGSFVANRIITTVCTITAGKCNEAPPHMKMATAERQEANTANENKSNVQLVDPLTTDEQVTELLEKSRNPLKEYKNHWIPHRNTPPHQRRPSHSPTLRR